MTDPHDLARLPPDLPAPEDDGAARHLLGRAWPAVALESSRGGWVDLAALGPGRIVLYAYPMTGRPGQALPPGWDSIPGARGCTVEALGFRDHQAELADLGAVVYGLSTQPAADQREAANRLHLPFALLSDSALELTRALGLPVMTVAGMTLLRRLTLILREGRVEHLFYPVFPTDLAARQVLDWLRT